MPTVQELLELSKTDPFALNLYVGTKEYEELRIMRLRQAQAESAAQPIAGNSALNRESMLAIMGPDATEAQAQAAPYNAYLYNPPAFGATATPEGRAYLEAIYAGRMVTGLVGSPEFQALAWSPLGYIGRARKAAAVASMPSEPAAPTATATNPVVTDAMIAAGKAKLATFAPGTPERVIFSETYLAMRGQEGK